MSREKPLPFDSRRRRVALMVEASLHSGRQNLLGIAEYVRQAGPWSIYYDPRHTLDLSPDWLRNWRGDGIITRVRNRRTVKRLARLGIPVVDILGNVPDAGLVLVELDHRAITELAVRHLLEHGYRSLACCGIRGPLWSRRRCDAFSEIVSNLGYESCLYELPPSGSKAWFSVAEEERLARWIGRLAKPVGIMAVNDLAGQRVLEACRRVGTMVPEEVGVVGVDNDEAICEISDPMLSTIIPGHEQLGFRAAELLDRLMQGEPPPGEPLRVGSPSILTRQSTDVQNVDDRDVAMAVRFIREHACHGIGVADVAEHVALSYSTLKRRFRRVLSRSVHDEIMRVRMERVRELLTFTRMTQTQIAQATGFLHQEYFGAVFKSQTGMTPRQFRRETASHSR